MRRFAPLVLVGAALLCLALFLGPGKTVYVDAAAACWLQNGTAHYPFADIQDALDAADEGATVRIAAGYYSPFTLTKSLHLHGAGIDNVRIVSEDGAPSHILTADGAIVEGLSFVGPGTIGAPNGVGLRIVNAPHALVLSAKFPFYATGIELVDSEVTLAATIVEECAIGVAVDDGSTLHASANVIVNNGVGVDCANGEVESWNDVMAGNDADIAVSCARF
ncbi:MAG TPA: hypothetical protein PKW95_21830 [bacterium]|nr:hypothetical protein [bacterium]